jgi:hypothetical protein
MHIQTRPTGYWVQTGLLLCALASVVILAVPVLAQPGESKQTNVGRIKLVSKEVFLGTMSWLAQPEGAVISPDFRHAAFITTRGTRQQAVIRDGIEEKAYDEVGSIRFSPDSQRLAYQASHGGKGMVVMDGREGPPFDGLGEGNPVFSPDGKRTAYVGMRRKNPAGMFVVVDGKEGPAMDELIDSPVFSPDSRHVAYGAQRGMRKFVVLDGKEGPHFDLVALDPPLTFSPDSQRLAYVASSLPQMVAVVDGKPSKEFEKIESGGIVFSRASFSALIAGAFVMPAREVENGGSLWMGGRGLNLMALPEPCSAMMVSA